MSEIDVGIGDPDWLLLDFRDEHATVRLALNREQVGIVYALMHRWLEKATGERRQAPEAEHTGEGGG